MAIDRDQKYRGMAVQGKYQRLYTHLCGLRTQEWRTSFAVDRVDHSVSSCPRPPVFTGPGGQIRAAGNGHSQALAWGVAGWETAEVDPGF